MIDLVKRLLGQAAGLAEHDPATSAAKRRAVSTAYYAAFHALMWLCAREIAPGLSTDSPEFERIYRQIDHGPLKQAFLSNGPLKTNEGLRQIGDTIIQLQDARKRADYAPPRPHLFTLAQTREYLEQARDLVSRLHDLSAEDRQTLAVHLLFPNRRQ